MKYGSISYACDPWASGALRKLQELGTRKQQRKTSLYKTYITPELDDHFKPPIFNGKA